MDYGGRILLTGENLANRIGIPGYLEEVNFLLNYFGVDYISDSIYATDIEGRGVYGSFSSSYNAAKPDHLSGNDTCFIYRGGKAGEGAGFSNNFGKTKSLFMGFSYDEMTDIYMRQLLLSQTLNMWGIKKSKEGTTGILEDKRDKQREYLLITDKEYLKEFLPLYDLTGRKLSIIEKTGIYIHKDKNGIKKIIFIK